MPTYYDAFETILPQKFGTTPLNLKTPHHVNYNDAERVRRDVEKFSFEAADIMESLKKENRKLSQKEKELLQALPELKRRAEEAKTEYALHKANLELMDCIRRFDALGLTTDDPFFNIRFTFEHNLDLCQPYLQELFGRDLDTMAAITDPNYLDQLIIEQPDAVYIRGFLYMVAEGAYEQHTQSLDAFNIILNNPHLSKDQVKYLLVHQQDVDNNTFVNERMRFYLATLAEAKRRGGLVDERTNGHHLNYFKLPNLNLNTKVIRDWGVDKDGNFYTDAQIEAYTRSLASRPMLAHDFGYKPLIRLTDQYIRYQAEQGLIFTPKSVFRKHDIVEEYEHLTAPNM